MQLALNKLKNKQCNNNDCSEVLCQNQGVSVSNQTTVLPNDDLLSTKLECVQDKNVLGDENNNDQNFSIFENNNQEETTDFGRIAVESTRHKNIDSSYSFVGALFGDVEDEYYHDIDKYLTEPGQETTSDVIETFPTTINTVSDANLGVQYCDDGTIRTMGASSSDVDEINKCYYETAVGTDDESFDENFDLDDSLQDPDYAPLQDDTESTDDEVPMQQQLQDGVENENTIRRRKRKATREWDRSKQKTARMQGKEYKGLKRDNEGRWKLNSTKTERKMKARGCSKQCEHSKIKCCGQLSEVDRNEILQKFWKEFNWEEKKVYVKHLITESEAKTKQQSGATDPAGRRGKTYTYFLTVKDLRYCVCKPMFLSTLGIGEKKHMDGNRQMVGITTLKNLVLQRQHKHLSRIVESAPVNISNNYLKWNRITVGLPAQNIMWNQSLAQKLICTKLILNTV